jgi:hypothetical protein
MTPPLHRAPIMTTPLVLIVAAAIKVGRMRVSSNVLLGVRCRATDVTQYLIPEILP